MRPRVRVIYRIEAGADCPGVARGIVSSELSGYVRPSKLDELRLLISELVTHRVQNGVEHETITLDLCTAPIVRCGVVDHGPLVLPDGWGRSFLDQLAGCWGVTRSRGGTSTWFETEARQS
jgi:hypothetical protein